MMDHNQYIDKQYAKPLSKKAIFDLNLFFFKSFFRDCHKMLDIGCSVGRILELNSARMVGVDIDRQAIALAKSKGFKASFADLNKKLKVNSESFDGIFCSQVIEHLTDPLASLKEMKRLLTPNGKIVLITPDYLLNHDRKKDGFWSDYTHKTPFTEESLLRLAYDAGFDKFRVYHFPGRIWRILLRKNILGKEKYIRLSRRLPLFLSQDLILEAIK